MVLQAVTDPQDLSELNAAPQQVTDPQDLQQLGQSQQPWYNSASDKIMKVMNFINNPGYAIRGEQPPQVNDLDATSAFTTIPELAQKVANWTAEEGGKVFPNHPNIAAGIATALSTIGSAGAGPSPMPDEDINMPGQGIAQNLGRRALGINKGMLKKLPGGEEAANRAAQTMLDQGVIQPAGASTLLENAQNVLQKSGKNLGNLLSQGGASVMNTNDIGNSIIDQLAPKFSGGLYDEDAATVDKIMDTVTAQGDKSGNISFEDAQSLKNVLKAKAGSNWNTDNVKAALYQRAYGIVSDAMDQGVEKAAQSGEIPSDSLQEYQNNKTIYGAAKMATTGLNDAVAREAANNILSLRGTIIGAAALAKGDVTPALEALGAWQLAERYGAATGASIMNKLSGLSIPVKSVVIGNLLSKGGTSQLLPNGNQAQGQGMNP